MIDDYEIVKKLNDEVIGVTHWRWGFQLWTLGHMTKQIATESCVICSGPLKDKAFRPITNASNRRRRICQECGQK